GISTAGRSMRLALRMRVSMSAIGSVIMAWVPFRSPARLAHAGDQAAAGHVPETDAADAELAVDGPRPPAQLAAQADADLLARRHLDLLRVAPVGLQLRHLLAKRGHLCGSGHSQSSVWRRIEDAFSPDTSAKRRQPMLSFAERHAEGPQQLAGLVVVVGRRHEGDVHALRERHL